ncbi:hypothetical protein B0H14DRAFT_1060607 [Mycena olivaceomarginata]|nr:hypothetical protein B0H14DRAFT_1060607 [Mycena olivaceomarginata]
MVSIPVIYVFLASFCTSAHAVLVNRTIENWDPLVRYNCTISRCTATPPVVQWPSCIPGDENITYAISPCRIEISFTGIAVYAFLACGLSDQLFCDGQVDSGEQIGIRGVNNMETRGLVYFDHSLSDGAHTLVITGSQIALDAILYTVDDGHPERPVGPTVGGAVGGLGLIAIVVTLIVVRRRSANRGNTPSLVLEAGLPVRSHTSNTPQPCEDQTAFRLRTQRERSGTSLTATTSTNGLSVMASPDTRLVLMKREQTHSLYEPRPLAFHADSGLRLMNALEVEEVPPHYAAE